MLQVDMESSIGLGDSVVLKGQSNCPKMIVNRLIADPKSTDFECVWVDVYGNIHREEFSFYALIKVKE